MIRVELQGGLGNQLFIWAMAHRLSEEYRVQVKLVIPVNKLSRTDRSCELFELVKLCDHDISIGESHLFSIFTKIIDKVESHRILKNLNFLAKLGIVTKKNSDDISISVSHPLRLMRGYFQCSDLPETVKSRIYPEIIEYLNRLQLPNIALGLNIHTVLHIRRGDTKEIADEWGILSLEYYKNLVNEVNDVIICTDALELLKEIKKNFPVSALISSTESSPWQVLKIISDSQIFIMANSTLSWWGAWLAVNNKNSQVFFPDPWRPNNERVGQSLKIRSAISAPSLFEQR
jgi:hypothetical protein